MKIILYYFGRKNEVLDVEKELLRRINFKQKMELVLLPQAGIKDGIVAKKKEGELFLSRINELDFVVALDEMGKEMDSPQFSQWIQALKHTHSALILVIGGAYGLDKSVLKRANTTLRFGKMTWTRNLFRYMALEQIYRAIEIEGGSNFHK